MKFLALLSLLISTLLSTLLFSQIFILNTSANSLTPTSVVETIIDKAKILNKPAEFKSNTQIIESFIDFNAITKSALGDHKPNPDQQHQIQSLLKEILTKTVYPETHHFFQDVEVKFQNEKKVKNETIVTALVIKGSKQSNVQFWLKMNNSSYQVVDLAINGDQWVENIGFQFDDVIRKYGISGLISRMKKRVQELKK